MKNLAYFLLLAIFLSLTASAHEVSGVAKVIDGDTIEVRGTVVRLLGIDAAETGQRCVNSSKKIVRPGDIASDRMESLVKEGVTCSGTEYDAYNRLLANCTTAAGENVNRIMVVEGLAWAFIKFSNQFVSEEKIAQSSQLGVWQLSCEEPWVFREKRWKVAEQKSPYGCPIKGNISNNGHIYHTPWSRHYNVTSVNLSRGERWFCSEKEALDAGWRAPIR